MAIELSSSSFRPGEPMPAAHTCDGPGLSPPLAWSDLPPGAKSLALIVDDPDAKSPAGAGEPFVHWVVYNVPTSARGLPLGAGGAALPSGAMEGRNDAGQIGYLPPCPPSGRHRYIFRLYALESMLPQRGAITAKELESSMSGRVLATTELIAVYGRQGESARQAPLPAG